jgi:hypothetical protein
MCGAVSSTFVAEGKGKETEGSQVQENIGYNMFTCDPVMYRFWWHPDSHVWLESVILLLDPLNHMIKVSTLATKCG